MEMRYGVRFFYNSPHILLNQVSTNHIIDGIDNINHNIGK